MRFPATAVVILYFCVSPLSAQSSRPPVPVPAASLPPMQLEGQWTTALINRDARTFERLLAPGFVYTEDATVMGRNDVIRNVSGPDRVEWARNEGMRLHDFGDVQQHLELRTSGDHDRCHRDRCGGTIGREDRRGPRRTARRMANAGRRLRQLTLQRAVVHHAAERSEPEGCVGLLNRRAARTRRAAARGREYDVCRHAVSQRFIRDRPGTDGAAAQMEIPA